jgi:hypothetical protein
MAVQTRIQVRRGTLAQWNAAAVVLGQGILYQGEIGYETDTGRFKVGDGSTAWGSLTYASVLPSSFVAGSGIALTPGTNGSTLTISLSDPTIQVSDITDFAEGVDDRVASLLQAGNNISLTYNDSANTLTINSTLGTEEVQDAIGTYISGVSGISVGYNDTTGYTTIGLSDLTVQLADITDLSSNARTFLTTPSSNNLSTLVTDETGSGPLVFANSPTMSGVTVSGVLTANRISAANGNFTVDDYSGAGVQVKNGYVEFRDSTLTFVRSPLQTVFTIDGSGNLSSLGTLSVANNAFSVNSSGNVAVVGNLTVSGSGLVASNINNFDSQVRTSRLDQMTAPTAAVSFNSQKITNLADPTSDQDAATKAYVDATRSGLDVKQSVRVATTSANSNLILTGLQTIDGIALAVGDRVLVKDHVSTSTNGIYVASSGSWVRAADADTSAKVTAGMFTFVAEGTTNADSGWVLTTNDTITLGTTGLAFAQFSGAGQITAGSGLVKNGNTLDVGGTAGRIVVNADSIDLATVTRSDTNYDAAPASTYIGSITTDSYGRVTSVLNAKVFEATDVIKGVASFSNNDFTVTSGVVTIKTSGVGNTQLENSAVTVGSTSISLGGSSTTLAGLSSVTSTSFVGALTGNASTATALQTARTINGTSFDGTANITISFIDGGTP